MKQTSEHSKIGITLEDIARLKTEKLEEIRNSQKRIHSLAHNLFHPQPSDTGSSLFMNNLGSGIAIFNGIITGFKIIKKIQNLFRNK